MISTQPSASWPDREHAAGGPSFGFTRAGRLLALLGRHQLGALVTTIVDFSTMIALVQLAHARPSIATVVGAAIGAVTNFTLGRYWIFDRRDTLGGRAPGQALRYALVSAASLALNAAGVWLLAERATLPYVIARTLVAVFVSLAWNFPMQRRFVFRAR